jgi:PhnB protein
MSKINYIPEGFHTVTPYFVVPDGPAFMNFLKRAFDAEERFISNAPDGSIAHAEMRLGDSPIEFGQANSQWPAMRLNMHLYVPDADATYRQALDAGARSIREPRDEFYGDRTAGIEDPARNIWWIATHIENVTPEELARRAAAVQTAH